MKILKKLKVFFNNKIQYNNSKSLKIPEKDEDRYEYYISVLSSGKRLPEDQWEDYCDLGLERVKKIQEKSSNPKFHRTASENYETLKFSMEFEKDIESFNSRIYGDFDFDNINKLKKRIKAIDEFKKFAYSKGDGGKIYFQDMFEHCHNSKNDCFSLRDKYSQQIEHLEMIETLKSLLIKYIKSNNGVVQKDLYKDFPGYDRYMIQKILREFDNNDLIIREKYKQSYKLKID